MFFSNIFFSKKTLAIFSFLSFFSSFVSAGTFTPAAGTTITTTSVTVAWQSAGSEQWVRAFNADSVRTFDSGRQTSSTGQVDVPVAASTSELTIIFYEKNTNGAWGSTTRTYSVSMDGSDGDGDSGGGDTGGNGGDDTLAALSCSTDQIAKFNGSIWVCAADDVSNLDAGDVVSAFEAIYCVAGEELMRTNSGKVACLTAPSDCPILNEVNALFANDLSLEQQGLEVGRDETSFCFANNPDHRVALEGGVFDAFTFTYRPDNDPAPEQIVEIFIAGRDRAAACEVAMGCENFGR